MKPNFALSLSFDGIRLMHRSGTGWTVVGDVPLDASDLAGELAMLRKTALALDPAGLRTKILLPNDQIRYLALDTTRASESDVRAALDGATPYPVADLVYDFQRGGGRTYVAAVARETLAEAEAFASEHRFGPVSFAGVPEEFTFVGEAFFGPTKAAQTLLPPGETVERDAAPVKVQAKPARTVPAPAPSSAPVDVTSRPIELPAAPAVQADHGIPAGPDAGLESGPESEAEPAAPVPAAPAPTTDLLSSGDQPTAPESPIVAAPATDDNPPPSLPESMSDLQPTPEIDVPKADATHPPADATPPTAPAADKPVAQTLPVAQPLPADQPVADTAMQLPETPAPTTSEPAASTTDVVPVFASRARSARATNDAAASTAIIPGPLDTDTPNTDTPAPIPPKVRPAPHSDNDRIEPVFARRTPTAPAPSAPMAKVPADATHAASAPAITAKPAIGTGPVPAPQTPPRPGQDLAVPVGRNATGPAVAGAGRLTIDPVGIAARSVTATAGKPGSAPTITGVSGVARPSASVAAGLVPQRAVTASPPVQRGTIPPVSPALSAPVMAPLADVAPVSGPDPDDIPAKPARRSARTPSTGTTAAPSWGKPRFLGLILTALLILAMLAVAAWATISDTVVSRWLFGETAETSVADTGTGPLTVPVAIPLTEAMADSAGPDAAPADPLPQMASADADLPADLPENLPADLPEDTATLAAPLQTENTRGLDATASAAAAAAVATAIAAMADQSDAAQPDAGQPVEDTTAAAVDSATPETAPADGTTTEGTIISAQEIDRFYAATGVWLRAPRLPLTPTTETVGGLQTASIDSARVIQPAPGLAALGTDPGLVTQLNPPAPGTQFPRDDRGFFLATAEGTVTPDGLTIYAGAPPLVPPTRPGTVAPIQPDVTTPPETATAADPVLDPAAAVAVAAPTPPSVRPQARPDSILALTPDAETPDAETALPDAPQSPEQAALAAETTAADALAGAAVPATAGGVTLAGLRPRERPAGATPDLPDPAAEIIAFDGPRPATRPEGLAPEGATSSPETELAIAPDAAVDPVTDVTTALAAIVVGARDPLATATPQAVAVARRPDARPTNFGTVVEQQTARLARAQPAAAAPEQQTAAAAATSGNLSAEEQAETAPETASNAAAAPSGPIPGGVADAATFEDAMALREINLIGVYGRPNERRALVRLSNGNYLRVEVGDTLDGGQVAAISDSALNYVRRGRTVTLEIPSQ